jgi:diguanylate cyclase
MSKQKPRTASGRHHADSHRDAADLDFDDLETAGHIIAAGEKVAKSAGRIEKALQNANVGATAYDDALNDFSGKISTDDGDGAPAMVAQMLQQTQEMRDQNSQLRNQLEQSVDEINKLRQALEMVKHEAVTDELTNVGNRKHFDMMLREMTDKATRKGVTLCLLLFDVDNFKAFNDTHGHQTGDQVLRLVAHTLKENVKGRDVVARYGGEEFAVILSDIALRDALKIADGIRGLVAKRRIIRKSTDEVIAAITISGGVALHRPGEPLNALIERSDAALYRAKDAGRNQVLPEAKLDPVIINR